MPRPTLPVLALLFVLAGTAACGDDNDVVTDPTPVRETVTEPLIEGTLTINGSRTHPFVATGSGEIRVTVTTLSPNSAAVIGVSLGTFNSFGACQIVIANDSATQGTIVIGNAGAAGTFCVRVNDVGLLAQPTAYALTVVHY